MEITNYISFENHGTINKNSVKIGNLILYFSYKTIVAFADNGSFNISENIWTKTTGKFLNELNDDKKIRLPYAEFKERLTEVLIKHNFLNAEIGRSL